MSWKKNKINAAIQVLPEAEGKIRYSLVDVAIEAIQKSGLRYQVCPFETVVECEYDELPGLLESIHEACKEAGAEKMLTNLKIQVDFSKEVRIEDKMGKYSYIFLISWSVFLATGCSKRSSLHFEFSQQQLEILKEYTTSFPDNTQLSIAVLNDSSTSYLGILIRSDSLIKINNRDSVFEIGSISKIFTSTMLTDLLLNGKIQLDEPIDPYLPFNLKKENNENEDTLPGFGISFSCQFYLTTGNPCPGTFDKGLQIRRPVWLRRSHH